MPENGRWFMNAYLNILLSKADSAAGISMIEHDMLENFFVPPHVHHAEDETFYILEGTARFMIDGAIVEMSTGDSLHVPGGQAHAFKIVSPRARFLTITNGPFENMVREASTPAERPEIPAQAPFNAEDQRRLAELCELNGIEFVGAPID